MSNLSEYREYNAPEVELRCVDTSIRLNQTPIRCQEQIPQGIIDFLSEATVEHIITLQLGNDLRLINYSIIAKGSLSNAVFSMSSILQTATLSNANSVLVLHNHLSLGDIDTNVPKPSREDKDVAIKTFQTLRIAGIELADFVIVGPNKSLYSFREHDIAPFNVYHEHNLSYVK